MSIIVVGSVALDTIRSPYGGVVETLGGAAVYFSAAASLYTEVKLIGVVGEDFDRRHIDFLRRRGIDISGLQIEKGKTFRWVGEYGDDPNIAKTIETELNVFAGFCPKIPQQHKKTPFVFLANIDPELQLHVLQQIESPKVVACDTMNYWIRHKRKALLETISHVDVVLINDAEVKELCGEYNLIRAARRLMEFGPRYIVVKKGEHGAIMFSGRDLFIAPAFPLERVCDPTGAGDTFAGGFIGFLASLGEICWEKTKEACIHGSILASFAVEGFGLERLASVTLSEVTERLSNLKSISLF